MPIGVICAVFKSAGKTSLKERLIILDNDLKIRSASSFRIEAERF